MIFRDSYQHLLSSSQSPVFWPRILQPSEHAESPKKHLNPASETYAKLKVTKITANFLILMMMMKITCLNLFFNWMCTNRNKESLSNINRKSNLYFTNFTWKILIKITQNHYLDTTFLQNCTTDFDETLHVAWARLPEGFGTIGISGYSPVLKKGGWRPPPPCEYL